MPYLHKVYGVMNFMKIRWKTLIIAVLIPLITGSAAALISRNAMKNFENINQPPLSPPMWLFPVAWTVLYILMGIASYLVFTSHNTSYKDMSEKRSALAFYALQLFFNFVWTLIFFNLEQYFFSFVWLVVLWVLIIITMVKFFKIDRKSGFLMLPYLLWVTFAGYLNFGVFLLN